MNGVQEEGEEKRKEGCISLVSPTRRILRVLLANLAYKVLPLVRIQKAMS